MGVPVPDSCVLQSVCVGRRRLVQQLPQRWPDLFAAAQENVPGYFNERFYLRRLQPEFAEGFALLPKRR